MNNRGSSGQSQIRADHRLTITTKPTTADLVEDNDEGQAWEIYRKALRTQATFCTVPVAGLHDFWVERDLLESQRSTLTAEWHFRTAANFLHLLHRASAQNPISGQAMVAKSDAEVDKINSGREGSYAKLALARTRYYAATPKVYKSPEAGVVLQSSTDKGTLNLIFEGDQAILVRSTDDFMVQVNCSLNPKSINELLDIYEGELDRISSRSDNNAWRTNRMAWLDPTNF